MGHQPISNLRPGVTGGSLLEVVALGRRQDAKRGLAESQGSQKREQRTPIMVKLVAVLLWTAGG